jgi:hypothetical protein
VARPAPDPGPAAREGDGGELVLQPFLLPPAGSPRPSALMFESRIAGFLPYRPQIKTQTLVWIVVKRIASCHFTVPPKPRPPLGFA